MKITEYEALTACQEALTDVSAVCAKVIPDPQWRDQVAACFAEMHKGLMQLLRDGPNSSAS